MAARTFDPQPIFMNVLPDAYEWACEGYIPEDGITCILGKPGSYKTFGTIDAACCLATGLNLCGRRVGPPKKVIYIAADAGRGAELRIIAWVISHRDVLEEAGVKLVTDVDGRESLPNLLLWPRAVNLHGPAEVAAALADIKELGLSADVLCIDTLFHSAVGADLTAPKELLPILIEVEKLMKALGAKTGLLVHHTTKDGENYFGSVTFMASLSAMILFSKKEGLPGPVAKVKCERMREGEFFEPFEIRLEKVTVKTKPDQWGQDEVEMLAVVPGEVEAGEETKDAKLDMMEMVLSMRLGNKATFMEWFNKMVEVLPQKAGKAGISKSTFVRQLKATVARGSVVKVGEDEGAVYCVVAGRWARMQPGPGVHPKPVSPIPLGGDGENDTGFGGGGLVSGGVKPVSNGNDTDQPTVVVANATTSPGDSDLYVQGATNVNWNNELAGLTPTDPVAEAAAISEELKRGQKPNPWAPKRGTGG